MIKEKLEKEAIKCMHEIKYWLRVPIKKETEKDGISEILKLTEPREKRIADLEAENEQIKNSDTLCKLIGEQKRKITDLEAQIERMKCCGNCSHFKLDSSGLYPINVCELTYPNRCKDHDKWEIEK